MADGLNLPQPVLWEWLTTQEIAGLTSRGVNMAILPVGSTEQHGPHLSLNVDSVCADSVAKEVSRATGVPVLPLLPYGAAWGHTTKWPGTLSLSPTTLAAVVSEIGEWLAHCAGISRLLILNGHITNQAPLRCALEKIRFQNPAVRVALRGLWEISPRVAICYTEDGADWHANSAETSLMMALFPRGVREGLIDDDPDRTTDLFFSYPVDRTSANGATGMPTRASAKQGHCLLEWIVEDLAAQVKAAIIEEPPFPSHGEF